MVATSRNPFDLLAESAASASRIGTEETAKTAKTDIWLGLEDSNSRIWRRGDARWPGLDQNGGAIAAQYLVQKGLDFRWQWSVSVAMPIRAAWP